MTQFGARNPQLVQPGYGVSLVFIQEVANVVRLRNVAATCPLAAIGLSEARLLWRTWLISPCVEAMVMVAFSRMKLFCALFESRGH